MSKLDDITTKLGSTYKKWKKYEADKNKLKEQFFFEIEKEFDDPVIKTEWVEALGIEDAYKKLGQKFPEFFIIEVERSDPHKKGPGNFCATLEENLRYRPFEYLNRADKTIYKKLRQEGFLMLDDQAIKDQDLDLWMEITRIPKERELIPIEELSDDIIARLQKYVYKTAPLMKLAAPRKATQEELEN